MDWHRKAKVAFEQAKITVGQLYTPTNPYFFLSKVTRVDKAVAGRYGKRSLSKGSVREGAEAIEQQLST